MVFAISRRRLDASSCKSLGGGAFSLGAGGGLVAHLAFPALLDLALSGGGSDVDLLTSCRGLPCITLNLRFRAASLGSGGE